MKSNINWILLVASLPSHHTTPRMRVWRAVKALGAAVLRDGAYLLPDRTETRRAFEAQAGEVIRCGGHAHVLAIGKVTPAQQREFRALFVRDADYEKLLKSAQALRDKKNPRRALLTPQIKRLRRELDGVRMTDYFPGAAVRHVEDTLREIETEHAAWQRAGEPRSRRGSIERHESNAYRGRTWVTRARPWVDRLASAWLIRRFIDRKARFLWIKDVQRCPRHAVGFDFDGATFTHVGSRVTFEVLLASFGLESDAALVRLGAIVHYLDAGGVPVPEASGLERILRGAQQQYRDDARLFAETTKTFDCLYEAFLQPT